MEFPPPLPLPVLPGIGSFIFNPLSPLAPPQSLIMNVNSHLTLSFVRAKVRSNYQYIVTEDDVAQAEANDGIVEIDLNNYVMDVVSVCDTPWVLKYALMNELVTLDPTFSIEDLFEWTDEALLDYVGKILADAENTGEPADDRAFRKFTQINVDDSFPGQDRFIDVVPNTRAAEYRLDNATSKSKSILRALGGRGLLGPSYRDGTSTKIKVDFNLVVAEEDTILPDFVDAPPEGSLMYGGRQPAAGDTLYISFVSISDHYLRQDVEVSHQASAIDVPPICAMYPQNLVVTNYRFFTWTMKDRTAEDSEQTVQVSGWRAVDAYNARPNTLAVVGSATGEGWLVDVPMNGGEVGIRIQKYMSAYQDVNDLDAFISDREANEQTLTFYCVDSIDGLDPNRFLRGSAFHQNTGMHGFDPLAYKESNWYSSFLPTRNYEDVVEHVYFNVHERALLKRDVDKWAFESDFANAMMTTIASGQPSGVPFMDNFNQDEPTTPCFEMLDATNVRFMPLEQEILYTSANAFSTCCVGGSFRLGGLGNDDIVSVVQFHSHPISEVFGKGTKILVERSALGGNNGTHGPVYLAVEGVSETECISAITDPSGNFIFAFYANDEGYISFKRFQVGLAMIHLNKTIYRPDQDTYPIEGNQNPNPSQFSRYMGYGSMLGEDPGITPGRIIYVYDETTPSDMIKLSTDPDYIRSRYEYPDAAVIEEMSFTLTDKLYFSSGGGYVHNIEIIYELPSSDYVPSSEEQSAIQSVMLVAKSGGNVIGTMDMLHIPYTTDKAKTLRMYHPFLRADAFELVGDLINESSGLIIHGMNVTKLSDSAVNDFLGDSPGDTGSADISSWLGGGVFFSSNYMSVAENDKSVLYVFFDDTAGSISCAISETFGNGWGYYQGVVPRIEDHNCTNVFAATKYEKKMVYVFYLFMNKILCKPIPTPLLEKMDRQKLTQNHVDGQILRDKHPSYLVVGDTTDESFMDVFTEKEDVSYEDPDSGATETLEARTLKEDAMIRMGQSSLIRDIDPTDHYFSAYVNNRGQIRLFFMGDMDPSTNVGYSRMLQCYTSYDDGKSWYDLWEWIENGDTRLRVDPVTNKTWLDDTYVPTSAEDVPQTIEDKSALYPGTKQTYFQYGINVHWSRLEEHKIEGEGGVISESRVMEIAAPYAFYQPFTDKVFLFYIYENLLLCKIFDDSLFDSMAENRPWQNQSAEPTPGGMTGLKYVLERTTKADFIDGDLSGTVKNEFQGYDVVLGQEITGEEIDGNIVFPYIHEHTNFDSNRSVVWQRICACTLPNGNVRVFYKNRGSSKMRAALWNGSMWMQEDLLKDLSQYGDYTVADLIEQHAVASEG